MGKKRKTSSPGNGAAKSTVNGPSQGPSGLGNDPAVRKMQRAQDLASAFPFNASKAGEYGAASRPPSPGAAVEAPDDPSVTGSTLTEVNTSPKTGGPAEPGLNPNNLPLDRVRVDSSGQVLTTNFAQPVADSQNSLKAGLRGPALLEDFILREKITHFDHERIPERIVHARGSAMANALGAAKVLLKPFPPRF